MKGRMACSHYRLPRGLGSAVYATAIPMLLSGGSAAAGQDRGTEEIVKLESPRGSVNGNFPACGEGRGFVQVNGSNTAGDDVLIDPDGERFWVRRAELEEGNSGQCHFPAARRAGGRW